jgi:hypothetical protein
MVWTGSNWLRIGTSRGLPFGAYDRIFITVRQLLVCWCGALCLTRGRVCRLQLLLVLASADIFGFDSRGTHDHNLLSQIRDFPFRRFLRLAGLRWRYSTPPPHESLSRLSQSQSHVTNDVQSVGLSWCRAPSGAHDQILIMFWKLYSLSIGGALSDERSGCHLS